MSRKPPPGRCVLCLNEFESLTWDHVFPQSWYSDTTPKNTEKPKIPACYKCNQESGRNEEELFLRLGLCLNPEDYKASGISKKALRSIQPQFAKNEKDRLKRLKKREKIIREIQTFDVLPTKGILPGFAKNIIGKAMTVPISEECLKKVSIKIVRGLTYLLNEQFIDDRYSIKVHFCKEDDIREVISFIEKRGLNFTRGPGIEVTYASLPKDPTSGLFYIKIWGSFMISAAVYDESKMPD